MDTHSESVVSVEQMAFARERRAQTQRRLLDAHQEALVCFMLNIPGPVKVKPEYKTVFERGVQEICAACAKNSLTIREQITEYPVTGYEFYAVVAAEPLTVKKILVDLEEETPIGRLYDIDVITPAYTKISREEIGMPPRTCLICDKDAHECGRNRTHTVDQMLAAIADLIRTDS